MCAQPRRVHMYTVGYFESLCNQLKSIERPGNRYHKQDINTTLQAQKWGVFVAILLSAHTLPTCIQLKQQMCTITLII